MRRLLAVLAAYAAFVPGGAAVAEDDPCATVNDLGHDTVGWGACSVAFNVLDAYYVWVSASGLAITCDRITGTLPGTTTGTWEKGSGTCNASGAVVASGPTFGAATYLEPSSFSYTAAAPATLASSVGTFSFSSPGYALTVSGTYRRHGAVWHFEGTQHFRPEPGQDSTGPFQAVGFGAPTSPGFALTFAG